MSKVVTLPVKSPAQVQIPEPIADHIAEVSSVQTLMTFCTSRLSGLAKLNLTQWLFPKRIYISKEGIRTSQVLFWLTPWKKEDEFMPFSRVASIRHVQGLSWDSVILETTGRGNTLDVSGLTKLHAQALVVLLNMRV